MCDIICTLYNITSTTYVITLLYLGQHNLYIWNHIQYAGQNIHYPCDITATSLCHHTHCNESITPTLCMTSDSGYIQHLSHYRRHQILTLWHQTTILWHYTHYNWHHIHGISVITSTVLMISHQLYLWDHPLYMRTSYPLYTTTYSLDF